MRKKSDLAGVQSVAKMLLMATVSKIIQELLALSQKEGKISSSSSIGKSLPQPMSRA